MASEKEIFLIHTTSTLLEENINGVPPHTLNMETLCLKDSLTVHVMTHGSREPQSFIAEGSVIQQRSHVFNVLEATENSMTTFQVTFIKTGKMIYYKCIIFSVYDIWRVFLDCMLFSVDLIWCFIQTFSDVLDLAESFNRQRR